MNNLTKNYYEFYLQNTPEIMKFLSDLGMSYLNFGGIFGTAVVLLSREDAPAFNALLAEYNLDYQRIKIIGKD